MILEVPCGNIESVHAAMKGGADRIELCSSLTLGGLTPSAGFLEAALTVGTNIFVMIRPREGDFYFSKDEFKMMLRDIEIAKSAGANGIVSGILLRNGEIDIERCRELVSASRPLPFTFHRAFDLTADAFRSLDILLELKADRLLTSGQAADAWSGRKVISELEKRSEGRITIMAGAGVNVENARPICEFTRVTEIHLSGRVRKKSEANVYHASVSMGKSGDDDNDYWITDAGIIKKVRDILD